MQARLFANSKVLVVLGLDTLQLNIFSHDVVRHIAAGRDEVATRPQVPAPERLAALSAISKWCDVFPLIACMTRLGARCGGTLSSRWT